MADVTLYLHMVTEAEGESLFARGSEDGNILQYLLCFENIRQQARIQKQKQTQKRHFMPPRWIEQRTFAYDVTHTSATLYH